MKKESTLTIQQNKMNNVASTSTGTLRHTADTLKSGHPVDNRLNWQHVAQRSKIKLRFYKFPNTGSEQNGN